MTRKSRYATYIGLLQSLLHHHESQVGHPVPLKNAVVKAKYAEQSDNDTKIDPQ